MDYAVKTPHKPLLQKIADRLIQTQQEIDELVVQLALGKAEAQDKFEDIKNDFKMRVNELRAIVADDLLGPKIKQKMDELIVQLALGKAESKEAFDKQEKKILMILEEVEYEVKPLIQKANLPDSFSHEIETFKLKLEVIRLKFLLKKFQLRDLFKEKMSLAKKEMDKLSMKIKEGIRIGKFKYNDFHDEINAAYKHVKRAVKGLYE